jgi:hypothetical protein
MTHPSMMSRASILTGAYLISNLGSVADDSYVVKLLVKAKITCGAPLFHCSLPHRHAGGGSNAGN